MSPTTLKSAEHHSISTDLQVTIDLELMGCYRIYRQAGYGIMNMAYINLKMELKGLISSDLPLSMDDIIDLGMGLDRMDFVLATMDDARHFLAVHGAPVNDPELFLALQCQVLPAVRNLPGDLARFDGGYRLLSLPPVRINQHVKASPASLHGYGVMDTVSVGRVGRACRDLRARLVEIQHTGKLPGRDDIKAMLDGMESIRWDLMRRDSLSDFLAVHGTPVRDQKGTNHPRARPSRELYNQELSPAWFANREAEKMAC